MPLTPEEQQAKQDADRKADAERRAAEANKKRNDARLDRMNEIADSADDKKAEEDDLEDLTDEVWAQNDRPEDAPRKTRAERIAEQEEAEEEEEVSEEEAAARLIRKAEAEDEETDAARDAGATDVRKKGGVTQYKVGEKWLTLAQVRELGGEPEGGEGDLHNDGGGDTTPPARRTSPTAAELEQRRVQAEEAEKNRKAEAKAKLKDLLTRVSMGDEEAIDQLAEMQADQSRVTPDLQQLVNEQVDARMAGRTDFQSAVAWFESEEGFADVLTTPRLKQEAGRLDKEMATLHPELTARQRLERVGKQLRQLRADFGGPAASEARPNTRQSKVERKKSIPQVPSAAGRPRPETEPDERESTQDAIRRMAQSRGQARAIKH